MDIQKFEQYLKYLTAETEKLLAKEEVSDENILDLCREIKKLQQSTGTDLPLELNKKVNQVNVAYQSKENAKTLVLYILVAVTLGYWAYLIRLRIRNQRLKYLSDLRGQLGEIHFKVVSEYL